MFCAVAGALYEWPTTRVPSVNADQTTLLKQPLQRRTSLVFADLFTMTSAALLEDALPFGRAAATAYLRVRKW
jgi:hypothetical protein